jgi:hypothetical protein
LIEQKLLEEETDENLGSVEFLTKNYNELENVLQANKMLDGQIRDQTSKMNFIT